MISFFNNLIKVIFYCHLQCLQKMIKLLIGENMEINEIINIYNNYQKQIKEFWGLL